MEKFNTIRLAVYGMPPVEVEYPAGAIIKPGMFCSILPNGTIIPDPDAVAASVPSPKLVAIENTHLGKGVSYTFADTAGDYQIGDMVTCYITRPGDKVWTWLAPGGVSGQTAIAADFGQPCCVAADTGWAGCVLPLNAPFVSLMAQAGFFSETFDNTGGSAPVRMVITIS